MGGVVHLQPLTFFFRKSFVVCELANYRGNRRTEFCFELLERRIRVFHCIVKERRDEDLGILFQSHRGQELGQRNRVVDIWRRDFVFASLIAMFMRCESNKKTSQSAT